MLKGHWHAEFLQINRSSSGQSYGLAISRRAGSSLTEDKTKTLRELVLGDGKQTQAHVSPAG